MLSAYIFARLFLICPTSRRPKSHFWTCAPWARRLPCAPFGGGRGEVLRQTSSALTFNFAAKRGETATQENDLAAKQSSAATRNIALCLLSRFRMAGCPLKRNRKMSRADKVRLPLSYPAAFSIGGYVVCPLKRNRKMSRADKVRLPLLYPAAFSIGGYVVCPLSKRKRKRQFPLATGKAFSFFSFA